MPISATRAILDAVLSGRLDDAAFRTDGVFGFDIPTGVAGVSTELLDPRSTWQDPNSYDERAAELAELFERNFEQKFAAHAPAHVAAAGPRRGLPAAARGPG
jgi:phosphoenolpyruvate carboxykinase (ATP)